MRVDALTLRAVAGELETALRGSRIETVIAPTPQAIALECYGAGQKHWLLISAHPQFGRVHLLPGKPQKLVADPSPFVMLLRKYLEGTRIDAIQAVPWERILRLEVGRGPAGAENSRVTLIAEIMGTLANVILVEAQEQMILGALRPVSANVNHYRAILPGYAYIPPPKQTRQLLGSEGAAPVAAPRILPERATAAELAAACQLQAPESADPAWRILLSQIAGMSPELAKEIACQARGDPLATLPPGDLLGWEAIAMALRAIAARAQEGAFYPVAQLDDHQQVIEGALWLPCRKESGGEAGMEQGEPGSSSQRMVGQSPAWTPMPSVNVLLAQYFAAREFRDALGANAGDLRCALKTAHDRLEKKLKAQRADLAQLGTADQLREEGELLLAFAHEVPPHVPNFTTPDMGGALSPRTIALDPRLSGVENANARFARYHKLRRAALAIPPQIDRAIVDLARVAQLQTDLDLAETLADLAQVRAEIAEARLGQIDRTDDAGKRHGRHKGNSSPGKDTARPGSPKGKGPRRIGGEPLRFQSAEGFTIYVGKNSRQNEQVTFTLATGNDLWFHARGVPGAHVIVKNGGRPVPEGTIDTAAGLAAWYSQSRGNASVPVDYTEQRYVRHMKDGGTGMVIYSRERTLSTTPRDR